MNDFERIFICRHRHDDVTKLLLQADRYPEVNVKEMATQISGWQTAGRKLPLWANTGNILYPVHLSMEQCSSEATGRYKGSIAARLVEGKKQPVIMDLTGGFGVDSTLIMLTIGRGNLIFVEQDERLCRLARHNLPLLGIKDFNIIHGRGEEQLPLYPQADLIYLDPARRNANGAKTVHISDCTPDVTELLPMFARRTCTVLLKLSPMLSIREAKEQLHTAGYGVSEVHVVSTDGECKELLLVLSTHPSDRTFCTNIRCGHIECFSFDEDEERNSVCPYTKRLEKYLYEPNASILKGGAFKSLATRMGLQKLHPNSHLYTNAECCPDFPGRTFEVVSYASFNKKELKRMLSDIKKANLTVRNFPMSVADLRKKLKISEGGNDYLFATTLADDSHVLIRCKKPS